MRVPNRAQAGRWGPVLVWMAVIFAFSAMPADVSSQLSDNTVTRKLAHLTEYAILGLLSGRAVGRPWAALAAGVLYAASDEWHQTLVPGRSGQVSDVLLDTVGVILGIWIHRIGWRKGVWL